MFIGASLCSKSVGATGVRDRCEALQFPDSFCLDLLVYTIFYSHVQIQSVEYGLTVNDACSHLLIHAQLFRERERERERERANILQLSL